MQVTFGTVSKKPNSTAQPAVTGRTLDVQIKDSSSILSPSIIVGVNDFDPSYNYAIIPKWNRRYFVSDSEVETGGRVTMTLTEDVLGTWKSQTLASTQYVVRSASQFDPMISDGEFVNTYNITQHTKNLEISYPYLTDGSYILRCINDVTTPTTTGITSYILTAQQVRDVCREVAKVPKNLKDEGAKTMFKPFNYITSLMWLPIAPEALITTQGAGGDPTSTKYAVEVGYFGIKNADGTLMYAPIINKDTGATIYIRNMEMPTNAYSDWRKYSDDYSAYNMYIPGVGTVNISASDTRNPLSLAGVVDGITGDVTWRLFSDGGTIATYNGSLGVNIQLGEFPPSKISYLSNQHVTALDTKEKPFGLAGGITALGNLAALGMNKLTYDIRNKVDKDFSGSSGVKALGTVSVLGTSGNMATAKAFNNVVITVKNFGTAEIPNSTAGRVLYSYRRLNTLSGFTVCSHSALSLSGAYDSETDAVKQSLDSGFYIE